ncbi:MAG: hypothetical protein ACI9HK_004535 [Pirellulaceae bacterium]|jgi:hypothetical protein
MWRKHPARHSEGSTIARWKLTPLWTERNATMGRLLGGDDGLVCGEKNNAAFWLRITLRVQSQLAVEF